MQDDQARDIEIDLCCAWQRGDNYETFDDAPPTARSLWYAQQRHLLATALDDAERIEISCRLRHVAQLENSLIAAGGNPALIGSGYRTHAGNAASLPYARSAARSVAVPVPEPSGRSLCCGNSLQVAC
jgi:hypothetical protein